MMSSPSEACDVTRHTQTPNEFQDFGSIGSESSNNLLKLADMQMKLQKQQQGQSFSNPKAADLVAYQLQQQHQQQQQQQQGGEFVGDSIFAPNQTVNLNELESDEREIESFKRFNYYFEPPKNKPKVNLNVKDIVVNNKKPTVFGLPTKPSDSPSSSNSIFDGISSSMSSQSDDLFADIGLTMAGLQNPQAVGGDSVYDAPQNASKQQIGGEINQSIISN